ncbi:MAG: fibronectin type III domain-containing protein, partial [Chloroflexi bacterium]|nr:fibronectin type III domain-containing protein [Chloroflexota bacterium]
TNVSTSNVTNDSITLNWTKSAGATSYEVTYNPKIFDFEPWFDVGDVSSYTFTALVANRHYSVSVRAKNANGVSDRVNASATTLDGTNIAPPPLSDLGIVSNITHNSFTLSWTKVTGATSYEISLDSRIDRYEWFDVGDVDSYIVTGLSPNTLYSPVIRAKNAYGVSQVASFPTGDTMQDGITTLTLPASPASGDEPYVPKPTPTPIHDTLNHLPPGIQVSNWHDGAQGRQVDHIGVGREDLVERGILDAVDLWGYITPGMEVCFAQFGRIVFLDAAYMPRQLFDLPAHQRDGMTCAMIDRAGTVVLLRGEPPLEIPPEPSQPQILSDCEVWLWENVNFRESPPDGPVITVTGLREWLPASEKHHGYFKVRRWATEGWISGDYVYTRGDCGS